MQVDYMDSKGPDNFTIAISTGRTIMLSQMQASYHRLEQSLQRLTDSIGAFNPSTTAADELVAADDALTDDLRTCKR